MLLELLGSHRCLALVGMGKNVGKTTALNRLVEEASRQGLALALTSIGRDGELVDEISSHPKPPVQVPVGTLVATTQGALPERPGSFDILETTSMRTALGQVVIARCLREAPWELSGPALGSNLVKVRARFEKLGAQLVLLDGAFDRRSSATPSLSDATLLVSGAALDPDIEVTVRDTAHRVELFSLPQSESPPAPGWVKDGEFTPFPWRSALGHEQELADLRPEWLRLPTAFTSALASRLSDCQVVVGDGTHALISAPELSRFRARGGVLSVVTPIRIPCLVANPYSPYGWRYPARQFLDRLAGAMPHLPIVDVVAEEVRAPSSAKEFLSGATRMAAP